jgi:hypothetical protein
MNAPIAGGIIALTAGELVAVVLLLLSLAANAIQLYQARTRRATLYHGLVGLFNSIGWLQARELEMLRQVRGRIHASSSGDAKLVLQEFAAHLHHAHYTLRLLHEQLVATAKSVNDKDPRWKGERLGYVDDQVDEFLGRPRGW